MKTHQFKVKCQGGPFDNEMYDVKTRVLPLKFGQSGIKSYEVTPEVSEFTVTSSTHNGKYNLVCEFVPHPVLIWKWSDAN